MLRAQLRVLDTAQWANFAAWDELSGPIVLERANAEGRPPEHYGLWVHAGHVPSGWRVAELRPGTFDTPLAALR